LPEGTAFFYKRIFESVGMLYKFKAIPAFNTKAALVYRMVSDW
jgi:hypothetical protein